MVGALLALAIVAMTIGLIRSESAGDLRTLTATGAGPRTRRALTASTAGALALLGVVLGTAGAYIALVAGYHADLGALRRPPFANLLALAIGLPLVAAGGGLAPRRPRAQGVRPPGPRLTHSSPFSARWGPSEVPQGAENMEVWATFVALVTFLGHCPIPTSRPEWFDALSRCRWEAGAGHPDNRDTDHFSTGRR